MEKRKYNYTPSMISIFDQLEADLLRDMANWTALQRFAMNTAMVALDMDDSIPMDDETRSALDRWIKKFAKYGYACAVMKIAEAENAK